MIKGDLDRINSTNVSDYQEYKSINMPSKEYLLNRFKTNSWNDILIILEVNKEDLYLRNYSKEDLIKILKDISNEKLRAPVALDVEEINMGTSTFISHFGCWNNALIESGFQLLIKSNIDLSKEELIEMYTNLSNKLERAATGPEIEDQIGISVGSYLIRFGNMANLAKLAGYEIKQHKSKYSKRIIKNLLLNEVKIKGSKLTVNEIINLSDDNFPSYTTILRYFETTKISVVWNEIGVIK